MCTGIFSAALTALMRPVDKDNTSEAMGAVLAGLCSQQRTSLTQELGMIFVIQRLSPALGVNPPSDKPQHSSTRVAPVLCACTADERESTQNSTSTPVVTAAAAGATILHLETA